MGDTNRAGAAKVRPISTKVPKRSENWDVIRRLRVNFRNVQKITKI